MKIEKFIWLTDELLVNTGLLHVSQIDSQASLDNGPLIPTVLPKNLILSEMSGLPYLFFFIIYSFLSYTVKKGSPAEMSLTKVSLAGNNIIPGQEINPTTDFFSDTILLKFFPSSASFLLFL